MHAVELNVMYIYRQPLLPYSGRAKNTTVRVLDGLDIKSSCKGLPPLM